MHRALRAAASLAALMVLAGCAGVFGKQYEYEEEWYLAVDGSATVVIDASVPSLIALRGLPLPAAPFARLDRTELRRMVEQEGCSVERVGEPWRRNGRRFVQIRLTVADVRRAADCALLAWGRYTLTRSDGTLEFHDQVGAPKAGDPGQPGWTGQEIVAIRLHIPSQIQFHNVRRIEDGAPGEVGRGNIVTWEQRLSDRRAGVPIDVDVRMDAESILSHTLLLFAGAFAAALAAMAAMIWVIARRGRRQRRDRRSEDPASSFPRR